MNTSARPLEGPWKGKDKIVVGIDIGPTDSGVSFACLQHGYDQTLHRVTHWPGQEAQQQLSRVPALVWYNGNRKAASFGAEALSPRAEEEAIDNDWKLAKHFQLHLYPVDITAKRGLRLDPLPSGVPLQQVYSDYLRYLLQYTKFYFEDHLLNGKQLWAQLKPKMEVVITCPSEWGIGEQTFLRSAVVTAGFVDGAASGQIFFTTQFEAMAHFFCHQTDGLFQPSKNIMICDAGESTVKATILSVITTQPALELKEHSSTYTESGGIFVDAAAERYLRDVLRNAGLSHEDIEEYTKQGVKHFSSSTRKSFCDATANSMIEIAGVRFNNPSIRTRRGRMELPGTTIQTFFDTTINEISTALDGLLQSSSVKDIILTGEFGRSLFLQEMLKKRFEPKGCKVTTANDSYSSCNVADGAVIWGTTDHSRSRALRFSYGFVVSTVFDPEADEHQGRETYVSSSGYEKVIGAWSQLANKGDTADQDEVTRVPFSRILASSKGYLHTFQTDLFAYTEEGKPGFAKDQQGKLLDGFRKICTMTADLSNLSGALQEVGAPGKSYWSLTYDLCLHFGGVELSASIEWQEKGATRTVPVKIKPVDVVYLD